jgi:type II restriction enzyme
MRIFNDDAMIHEVKLYNAILKLKDQLETEYPNIEFEWKQKIYKTEIAEKLKIGGTYKPQSNSFVKPDGGVLFMNFNNKKYPILISEAKKQGTNVYRINEGLKKQAKGNAIERAFKNIEEFKLYCNDIEYFPYVIFAYGCDFQEGSSILDRLDAMTKYHPRNVNYTLHKDQKTTIFVRDQYFTFGEIYDILYDITIKIIKNIVEE